MRVALFFINLCILLLCGGNSLHATPHDSHIGYTATPTLSKNHQIKFFHKDQESNLIEDADTDLEEDYHFGTDNKDNYAKKYIVNSYLLLKVWYQELSGLTVEKTYFKRLKLFPPFCGYSSPIYIRQRVLRI